MTDAQDVNEKADSQDDDADDADLEQTNQSGDDKKSGATGFDDLPEATKAEIRKLRRENAKYRTDLKSYEDAQKTDRERIEAELKSAQERNAELERKVHESVGLNAVAAKAPKVGAISAKAVHRAIASRIEFDDDGEPTNIDALLEWCKKDDPALFKSARIDGGTDSPIKGDDFNAQIRRKAGRR